MLETKNIDLAHFLWLHVPVALQHLVHILALPNAITMVKFALLNTRS